MMKISVILAHPDKKSFNHAIAAAAITPTTDPVSMSIVMAPLIILYTVSIGLGYLATLGRKKKAQPS